MPERPLADALRTAAAFLLVRALLPHGREDTQRDRRERGGGATP